jgi:hypothetical protein
MARSPQSPGPLQTRHLNKLTRHQPTTHQAQSIYYYYPMGLAFIKAAGPPTQNLSPRERGESPPAPKNRPTFVGHKNANFGLKKKHEALRFDATAGAFRTAQPR